MNLGSITITDIYTFSASDASSLIGSPCENTTASDADYCYLTTDIT